jgi:3-isopropylmalate/(R)-2-methylmalate dehydratase small subunit
VEKFEKLSGIAAPLPLINVDTDMIIPKQFLKTIKRSGLGVNLFDEMRYDDAGREIPGFVLNKPQYRDAQILIAGANFGCGSSREHAPWAIKDFGIRCIIAPSYADIFYNNCFKNGLLPVTLPEDVVDRLFAEVAATEGYRLTVDLESQQVRTPSGEAFAFSIDADRRHRLLNGLDDIGLTLQHADAIRAYEARRAAEAPWLFPDRAGANT